MGWTYVIQEGYEGPVKIGRSKSPDVRLAELQTGNPRPLRLVYAWPSASLERLLHERYAALRIGGEWFDATVLDAVQDDALLAVFFGSPADRAAVRALVDDSLHEATV